MSEGPPSHSALVPDYAGHADVAARRLSDQQVRAWTGERLAGLAERLPVDGVRDRLDALLLRCEFGDQQLIRSLDDERYGQDGFAATIEAADRALIDTANGAPAVTAEGLTAFIDALERAFDARAAALIDRLKSP